ncbi:MAG: hypothetical protein WAT19_10490 [Ferruginibacter sp.]
MSCKFSIPFSASPEAVLGKAKTTVEEQGGVFKGDTTAGEFSLSVFGNNIAGSYIVNAGLLDIVISDKPFFVPCNTIEGYLKSKIS